MDVTTSLNDLVEGYFQAWEHYDISHLRRIFAPEASYEIRNKHQTFHGIEQIAAYWLRNQRRQQNLILIWDVVDIRGDWIQAWFQANFYDSEERSQQTVTGNIEFIVDRWSRKITQLSETYVKEIV